MKTNMKKLLSATGITSLTTSAIIAPIAMTSCSPEETKIPKSIEIDNNGVTEIQASMGIHTRAPLPFTINVEPVRSNHNLFWTITDEDFNPMPNWIFVDQNGYLNVGSGSNIVVSEITLILTAHSVLDLNVMSEPITVDITITPSPATYPIRYGLFDNEYWIEGYDKDYVNANPSSVNSLNIPDELDNIPVTRIYNQAFKDLTDLNDITLPTSIVNISSEAFLNCSNLNTISGGNILNLGMGCFNNCTSLSTIPAWNDLEFITQNAFRNCTSLETFDFATNYSNVKIIDSFAFEGSGLTAIDNFGNVKEIRNYAFYNCFQLETIDFTNVKTIGKGAFSLCSSLSSINLQNVEFINCEGEGAFFANNLSTITVAGSNTHYKYANNLGVGTYSVIIPYADAKVNSDCSNIVKNLACGTIDLSADDDIEKIADYAFIGCGQLTINSIGGKLNTREIIDGLIEHSAEIIDAITNESWGQLAKILAGVFNHEIINLMRYVGDNAFIGCQIQDVSIPLNNFVLQLADNLTSGDAIVKGIIPDPVALEPLLSGILEPILDTVINSDRFHDGAINYLVDNDIMGRAAARIAVEAAILTLNAMLPTIVDAVVALIITYLEENIWPDQILGLNDRCSNIVGSLAWGDIELDSNPIEINIAKNAFAYCRGITSVSMQSNVTSIGDSAFEGCNGISEIKIYNTQPPMLGKNAFAGINPNTILYISSGSDLNLWKDYTQYFAAISTTL